MHDVLRALTAAAAVFCTPAAGTESETGTGETRPRLLSPAPAGSAEGACIRRSIEEIGDDEPRWTAAVEARLIRRLADLEGGWPKMMRFDTGIDKVIPGAVALHARITYVEPARGGTHHLHGVTHRACETGYAGEPRCADARIGDRNPPLTGGLKLTVRQSRLIQGTIAAPGAAAPYRLCAVSVSDPQIIEVAGPRRGR